MVPKAKNSEGAVLDHSLNSERSIICCKITACSQLEFETVAVTNDDERAHSYGVAGEVLTRKLFTRVLIKRFEVSFLLVNSLYTLYTANKNE